MKRSEMIKFLENELESHENYSNGYYATVNGGELLLARLEELGMLPPLNDGQACIVTEWDKEDVE